MLFFSFLGYPDSVSDDYLSYQIWDTIQAFASSISGSLATQAVLEVNAIFELNDQVIKKILID